MSLTFNCAICDASFGPGVLDNKGKCPSCIKEFPTSKTKSDAILLHQPNLHLAPKLTEVRVRELVREEYNLIKAEIKTKALEKAREIKATKANGGNS